MIVLRLFLMMSVAASVLAAPLSAQEPTGEKAPGTAGEEGGKGEITLVESKPFFYCALEMKGSYEQHTEGFMKLMGAAAQQGLPMDQVPFGVYWNSPEEIPEEELKWELGFAVPGDAGIAEPLVKKKWDHTHHVTARFEGPYDSPDLAALYGRIYEWAWKNGYEPAGPVLEKFVSLPVADEAGNYSGEVEVLIPVVKK